MFGFINLTREVYRDMCAKKRGVIVNVVGIAGERPTANYIAGSMGNASLMAMSRALGAESLDYGVRVVGVNPGGTETDRQVVRWRARAEGARGRGALARAHDRFSVRAARHGRRSRRT